MCFNESLFQNMPLSIYADYLRANANDMIAFANTVRSRKLLLLNAIQMAINAHNGIVIGEDHTYTIHLEYLTDKIATLKSYGITKVFLEFPRKDFFNWFQFINSCRGVTPQAIRESLSTYRLEYIVDDEEIAFFNACLQHNIKLIPIDPRSEDMKEDVKKRMEKDPTIIDKLDPLPRCNAGMAKLIDEDLVTGSDKYIVIVGTAHAPLGSHLKKPVPAITPFVFTLSNDDPNFSNNDKYVAFLYNQYVAFTKFEELRWFDYCNIL